MTMIAVGGGAAHRKLGVRISRGGGIASPPEYVIAQRISVAVCIPIGGGKVSGVIIAPPSSPVVGMCAISRCGQHSCSGGQ